MILYHSKFLRVNYLELSYIMHFYWSEFAAYMDLDGFYQETVRFVQNRIERRADSVYLDWRHVEHFLENETFEWYSKHILPRLFSSGPHKLGILLNKSDAVKIPHEIIINGKTLPVGIFTDSEDLMKWLSEGAHRKEPGSHDHDHYHGSCGI